MDTIKRIERLIAKVDKALEKTTSNLGLASVFARGQDELKIPDTDMLKRSVSRFFDSD